jgi:hypothetical protein
MGLITMYASVDERFWAKVIKKAPDECWPWIGHVNKGRAMFFNAYRPERAARLAWKLTYGDIPDNQSVRHKCNNKTCCNPNHLYLK